MLTRFRGEYAEAVVADSVEVLEAQAERLHEGLTALQQKTILPPESVEYEGVAFLYFPEPTQEFGFTNPEAAQSLLEAFRAVGLEVDNPPEEMDDYRVDDLSCLDIARQRDGYYWDVPGLTRASFLIAPVIRQEGYDGFARDEFGQDPYFHLHHAAAVRFDGFTLLGGLLGYNPDAIYGITADDTGRVLSADIAEYLIAISGINHRTE